MTAIKAYTDLKQSKVLAEILPLESADMCYWLAWSGGVSEEKRNIPKVGKPNKDAIKTYWCPCWSLAALFDIIPEGVIDNCYVPNLQKENGKYSIAYGDDELLCIADNPIDACYEMILKLHELNLL